MNNDLIIAIAKEHRDLLPAEFSQAFDHLTIEQIKQICDKFGGRTLYIPHFDKLAKTCIAHSMLQEFDGNNYDHLAHKYHFSSRTVRRYIDTHKGGLNT